MADNDPTEWPCIAWSSAVGDYKIECWFQEKPRGTFTVVLVENGKELAREEKR